MGRVRVELARGQVLLHVVPRARHHLHDPARVGRGDHAVVEAALLPRDRGGERRGDAVLRGDRLHVAGAEAGRGRCGRGLRHDGRGRRGLRGAGGRGRAGGQLDHRAREQDAVGIEAVHGRDRADATRARRRRARTACRPAGRCSRRAGPEPRTQPGRRREPGQERPTAGGGHEPRLLQRGVALDGRRHHDRAAEHDLRVLGQAVEGGHRASGQVVGGRDRPQRFAGLHDVRHGGAGRSGEEEREQYGEQRGETQGQASMRGVGHTPRLARTPRNASAARGVTSPCMRSCAACRT